VVQKRGDQATTAETVSMDEDYPDREDGFCVGILNFAQIVTLGELTKDSGAGCCLGRDDEVCVAEKDFCKSAEVVET